MSAAAGIAQLVILIFVLFLLTRVILDLIQAFARDWRPSGLMLIIGNVVYDVTDPPLKALRRFIPPLTIGPMRFDLAFMVLFVLCSVAMTALSYF